MVYQSNNNRISNHWARYYRLLRLLVRCRII